MKKLILWVLLLGSFNFTQAQLVADTQTRIENVRADAFKQLIEKDNNAQIIDIRTLREYQAGHIKNAKMIDFYNPDFMKNIEKANLDKNRPVYIYCRSGHRSGIAVKIFNKLGFKHIVNLVYGINDWRRNAFELVF